MAIKLTKENLSKQLGISRPTLDKYLVEGFPKKITDPLKENGEEDIELQKILIENDIKLYEHKLAKLREQLTNLGGASNE